MSLSSLFQILRSRAAQPPAPLFILAPCPLLDPGFLYETHAFANARSQAQTSRDTHTHIKHIHTLIPPRQNPTPTQQRNPQVTHPEVTAEHVLGAASSLFFGLAAFLVRAAADLTIDACGAVIPSLCGTREARLADAYRRLQLDGGDAESREGEFGDGPGVAVSDGGVEGGSGGGGSGAGGRGGAAAGPEALDHELDQYFIL